MPLSRALTIFAPHRAAEREPAASVVVFHCSGKIKWMLLVRWKKVLLRCRGPEKAAGWKVCPALCAGGYFVLPCVLSAVCRFRAVEIMWDGVALLTHSLGANPIQAVDSDVV
jgi:hypothetical protein